MGGASSSPWIFRIWFSDGYVRIFRWIDGILDWRWIWLWRGPQPVLESRIFVGMHATLMLAKRQRQPLIMEGKIKGSVRYCSLGWCCSSPVCP